MTAAHWRKLLWVIGKSLGNEFGQSRWRLLEPTAELIAECKAKGVTTEIFGKRAFVFVVIILFVFDLFL